MEKEFSIANYFYRKEQRGILSFKQASSLCEELAQNCADVILFSIDGAITTFLWRGNFRRELFCFRNKSVTVNLPLNSIIAFCWGISLANNANLFPSFFAFAVGWLLLRGLRDQHEHPSPWYQPRSFLEILTVALRGKTFQREAYRIIKNQNIEQIEAYDRLQAQVAINRQMMLERQDRQKKERKKVLGIIARENFDVVSDLFTRESENFLEKNLPFKKVLLQGQEYLQTACVLFRVGRSIYGWRQTYISFWIVTTSFFAALLFALIPWTSVISWCFKISVWVFLGPWMKLVDIYFVRRRSSQTEEAEREEREFEVLKRFYQLRKKWLGLREESEMIIKIKDFKQYMFGEVSNFRMDCVI